MEVILTQLEIRFPRYEQKHSFAGFEIEFTSFAVLFLEHGGNFEWIGGTVSKIREKQLFADFEIGFTAFTLLFLEHWSLFWVDWRYCGRDTGKNVYSTALILCLRYSQFFFRTLEVILRRMEVRLWRYGQKHLFKGFEIGFLAFAVLFLEHLMLFCDDRRYGSQDTCEKVYSTALKLVFWLSLFYF